jgi:hypothetical protein
MYTSGSFVEQSDEKAAFWHEEAAKQEHRYRKLLS